MIETNLRSYIRLNPDSTPEYAQMISEALGKVVIECLIRHDVVTPTLVQIVYEELRLCFESLRAMRKVFQYRLLCDGTNNPTVSMAENRIVINVQFAKYDGEPPIDLCITNFDKTST